MFTSDFYHSVPKGYAHNLAFRKDLIRRASEDEKLQRELWMACSRDPLFYINTFCWTYDPRLPRGVVPFITYPFQDEAILQIIDAIYVGYDLPIEKSRDMGASWICIMVPEWDWHFHDMRSYLLGSRKEDYVDKTGDAKSLMWKIDLLHKWQPQWLVPTGFKNPTSPWRQKLHFLNPDNGSTIDGESTTGDFARGDRRACILLDEFAAVEEGYRILAATADVTNCRLINSTPQGVGNAFYDVVQKAKREKKPYLRLHWSKHPVKSFGLKVSRSGKMSSPWYEREKLRRTHPMELAQEVDIDYLGSDYQFFNGDTIERLRRKFCIPAYTTGELVKGKFQPSTDGRLQLWTLPVNGKLPDGDYALGIDTAVGTGASNSAISIGDRKTCTKIGEFVSPHIAPHKLGEYALALARWLGDAFIIWEANGPGRLLGNTIVEEGYRNIYYRQAEQRLAGSMRHSDVPGWYNTPETFLSLMGAYREALQSEQFINHSDMAVSECLQYVFAKTGKLVHVLAENTIDPTGAKANHGDRAVADALLLKGMKMSRAANARSKPEIPLGSFKQRMIDRAKERRAKKEVYW